MRALTQRKTSNRIGAAFVSLAVIGLSLAMLTGAAAAELTQSTSTESNFNGQNLPAGSIIWFQSVIQVHDGFTTNTNIHFVDQTLTFATSKATWTIKIWSGDVLFRTTATTATTVWENGSYSWLTTVPANYTGDVFISGFALTVNASAYANGISDAKVTWAGSFQTSELRMNLNWKWAAGVYSAFPATNLHASANSKIGVKPVDSNSLSAYKNSDHAGTPENWKSYHTQGARGGGGANYTGSYSETVAVKQGSGC
jgi:hypothetical protein